MASHKRFWRARKGAGKLFGFSEGRGFLFYNAILSEGLLNFGSNISFLGFDVWLLGVNRVAFLWELAVKHVLGKVEGQSVDLGLMLWHQQMEISQMEAFQSVQAV